jgi:hypothetical protein
MLLSHKGPFARRDAEMLDLVPSPAQTAHPPAFYEPVGIG